MGVAPGAADLGAHHTEGKVFVQGYRGTVRGVVETRPSAVGVELVLGAEQLRAAGPAAVDARGGRRDVLAAPRTFGGALAEDREGLGVEDRPPLLFGSVHRCVHLVHGNDATRFRGLPTGAGRGERQDISAALWPFVRVWGFFAVPVG